MGLNLSSGKAFHSCGISARQSGWEDKAGWAHLWIPNQNAARLDYEGHGGKYEFHIEGSLERRVGSVGNGNV
jgi:hypothetical protein